MARLGCRALIHARLGTLKALQAKEVHDVLGTFWNKRGVKGTFLATFAAIDGGVWFAFMMGFLHRPRKPSNPSAPVHRSTSGW